MGVDLLTRARAISSRAVIVIAALTAAILPLAPAPAQIMPQTGGGMTQPTGGDRPGMPGMPGMGDMPGYPGQGNDGPGSPGQGYPGEGDDIPTNNGLGDGAGWSSDPARMRRQIEDLNRNRPERAAQSVSTADAGEAYINDEILFTVARSTSADALASILGSNKIYLIERLDSELADVTIIRARILDQRAVLAVAAAVGALPGVTLAQPNFVDRLQYAAPVKKSAAAAPPLQYALGRLRLPQAHGVARGNEVLVGMIDSAVDRNHPDLDGAIVAIFDATGSGGAAHPHGTAIASLIAGHGRLTGSAPAARLLVARAFESSSAKGNSFTVLKSLDWLAGRGARVINLSFAGPSDQLVSRALRAAYLRGIILIAAAGNGGPASPPLYPGADSSVLAVTATDSSDHLFAMANRGNYIAVAAPGVDLFVAAPDGGYAIQSGTSFSAAEVSGIAALMIQRRPKLTPDQFRAQLFSSARVIGPGLRLADAYGAVTAGQPPATKPKPRAR